MNEDCNACEKLRKKIFQEQINGSHACFNICTFYSCSMQNDNSLGGLRTKTQTVVFVSFRFLPRTQKCLSLLRWRVGRMPFRTVCRFGQQSHQVTCELFFTSLFFNEPPVAMLQFLKRIVHETNQISNQKSYNHKRFKLQTLQKWLGANRDRS